MITKGGRKFTISNIAGGDARNFALDRDGRMSDASIRYARSIGFGGPKFGGPSGDLAAEFFESL